MAREFVNASSKSLSVDAAAVTVNPFTLACWFRANDIAVDYGLMQVTDKDAAYYYSGLMLEGTFAGDPVVAIVQSYAAGSATRAARTTTGYSANVWHHAAAVFVSKAERHAYIDGGSKGSNTTDGNACTNHDRTCIGAFRDSTPSIWMDGAIAEAAIWNVALTDAEVAALARGINPRYMRPGSLQLYLPIWGNDSPEYDLSVNRRPFTLNNNPLKAVDHAPVTLFTRKPVY